MNAFQWMGILTIGLLVVALALSVFILVGRHSKKQVYLISGGVFFLMLTISVLCAIIYAEYRI